MSQWWEMLRIGIMTWVWLLGYKAVWPWVCSLDYPSSTFYPCRQAGILLYVHRLEIRTQAIDQWFSTFLHLWSSSSPWPSGWRTMTFDSPNLLKSYQNYSSVSQGRPLYYLNGIAQLILVYPIHLCFWISTVLFSHLETHKVSKKSSKALRKPKCHTISQMVSMYGRPIENLVYVSKTSHE